MALELSISKYGLTASNGYALVENAVYDKGLIRPANIEDATTAYCNVLFYTSAEARNDGEQPIDTKTYNFDLDTASDADNILAQAYAYLKTLDEFSEATDV